MKRGAEAVKLAAPRGEELGLDDGSVARVADGAIEICAPDGKVIFRYRDGEAELLSPTGTLKLSAPAGGIVLDAATDVEIRAARDVVQRPGRRFAVDSPQVDVKTKTGKLTAGKLSLVAARVALGVDWMASRVGRYELDAEQLTQRAKDAALEVSDLLTQKVGRMRTRVLGIHTLRSRRNVMRSDDDTVIDGSKILLG